MVKNEDLTLTLGDLEWPWPDFVRLIEANAIALVWSGYGQYLMKMVKNMNLTLTLNDLDLDPRKSPSLAVPYIFGLESIRPILSEIWPIVWKHILTSGDLDLWPWPLKNNPNLSVSKVNLYTKFGDPRSNRSRVIVRTKCYGQTDRRADRHGRRQYPSGRKTEG